MHSEVEYPNTDSSAGFAFWMMLAIFVMLTFATYGVFVHLVPMLVDGGMSGGRRVLSEEWISRMRTPCAIAPFYGYLTWLNTGRRVFPGVSESSFFAFGAGSSFTVLLPVK